MEKETISTNNEPDSGLSGVFTKEKTVFARYMIVAAAVVVLLAGVMTSKIILAPMFMAVFFAVLLHPALKWLKSKGLPEILAIIVLSLLILAISVGISWVVLNSLNRFVGRIPTYRVRINQTLEQMERLMIRSGFLQDEHPEAAPKQPVSVKIDEKPEPPVVIANRTPPPDDENADKPAEEQENDPETIAALLTAPSVAPPWEQPTPLFQTKRGSNTGLEINAESLVAYARYIAAELTRLVSVSFITMLLVIFMLIEATAFPKKFAAAFGVWNITGVHLKVMAEDIRRYMVLKGVISLIVGLSCAGFLLLIDIEYALFWGLIAFFLNFIPNIGSIVAAIPPVILALVDHDPVTCLIVAAGYLFINCFMGYVIEPPLLGQGLGISPLVVLLSLLFWGFLLGAIGMFLAAPLSVVLKIVLQTFDETRWVSVLMADKVGKGT